MKTKKYFILFIFCVCLYIPSTTVAFFESPAEKAQKLIEQSTGLMEIGMKDLANEKLKEARNLLIKVLGKNPKDFDSLFVLALCEYCQQNKNGAERKFKILYNKKPTIFGSKIFEFYRSESKRNMQINRLQEFLDLVVKSYYFQSDKSRKNKAAKEFFRIGSKYLFDGSISTALLYYNASIDLNREYKPVIIQAFISASHNKWLNPQKQLILLLTAYNLKGLRQNQEIEVALKKLGEEFYKRRIKRQEVKNQLNQLPKPYIIIFINYAWPKVWETILTKKITGKGMDKKIHLLHHPTEVENGNKIIVEGKLFKIRKKSGWINFQNRYDFEDIHPNSRTGWHNGFAPNGEILLIKVQKLVQK